MIARNYVGETISVWLVHFQQGGHRLHAVPEILQAQVFIRGVLIIVIIGDWNGEEW